LMMAAFGVERRATAMGWFQFATTGAPTIGLVVGGPLVDVVGWRGIFWVFAVVSLIALVLAVKVMRESELRQPVPLDIAGSLALAGTILFALLSVSRGVQVGVDDPLVLAMLAASVLALVAFIRVERRAPHPLLRLDYFRRVTFTAPLAANALNQFAYMGGFVVTPLLLGDRYGYTVGTVSLLLAPRPGAFAISSPLGGWLATKIGEGIPMVAASLMMVASMVSFALGVGPGMLVFVIIGLALSGVSAGVGAPAFTTLVASSVESKDLGVATGMNQTMLFVGIVSGIQIMLVVLGETADKGRFVGTFLFGAAVAAVGLLASGLAAASARQRARSAVAA
jgi:MFS family permease